MFFQSNHFHRKDRYFLDLKKLDVRSINTGGSIKPKGKSKIVHRQSSSPNIMFRRPSGLLGTDTDRDELQIAVASAFVANRALGHRRQQRPVKYSKFKKRPD